MHSSKLPLSQWAIAFYLYNTNLKGVSSMKLHRDLGISQSSAWYMAHRIRGMWNAQAEKFSGPVEVDETYIGGKERNKHEDKKLNAGRGPVGKTAVVGMKDRRHGTGISDSGRAYRQADAPILRRVRHRGRPQRSTPTNTPATKT